MFQEPAAKTIKIMVVGDVEHVHSTLASTMPLHHDILSFGSGNEALAELTKQGPLKRARVVDIRDRQTINNCNHGMLEKWNDAGVENILPDLVFINLYGAHQVLGLS